MRPDLDKCTTECYRRGAGSLEHTYKIKFGGKVEFDPNPEHEYENERGGFYSSARRRHKEHKDFGDKLGALRGNVRKNVGRPWDDVFSEFCASLDRRGVSGYHIWTHLKDEVELHTYMDNGVVYERGRYGCSDSPVSGYYVHPITGILEYKKPKSWKRFWRSKPKEPILPAPDYPGWEYKQMDGLWFRVKFVNVYDYYKRTTQVVSQRRSANKKEIAWIKSRILAK